MKIIYIMHSKQNDCTVCAVMNTLITLGILAFNREDVEKATLYNEYGGFADLGLQVMAKQLNLQGEMYPTGKDVTWVDDPNREHVKIVSGELYKNKIFEEYKRRLKNGWAAVTSHRWGNTENFHAVALIGVEGEKIKVCCSLKGIYLVDEDFLVSERGQLNGLMNTYWVKKN